MQTMCYIGLDVHKRTINYCLKDGSGTIHAEGTIPATRFDLDRWMKTLPQPWFTGWIYDHLQPHAAGTEGGPPAARLARLARIHGINRQSTRLCDVRSILRLLKTASWRLLHNRNSPRTYPLIAGS
jgi:hypothetical protein